MEQNLKLGSDVLLAIMAAVQKGLSEQVDISDELRKLDLWVSPENPQILRIVQR